MKLDTKKFLELFLKDRIRDMSVLSIAALVERVNDDFNTLLTFTIFIPMGNEPNFGKVVYEFQWIDCDTSESETISFEA